MWETWNSTPNGRCWFKSVCVDSPWRCSSSCHVDSTWRCSSSCHVDAHSSYKLLPCTTQTYIVCLIKKWPHKWPHAITQISTLECEFRLVLFTQGDILRCQVCSIFHECHSRVHFSPSDTNLILDISVAYHSTYKTLKLFLNSGNLLQRTMSTCAKWRLNLSFVWPKPEMWTWFSGPNPKVGQ